MKKTRSHLIKTVILLAILVLFVGQYNNFRHVLYEWYPSNYGMNAQHNIVLLTYEFVRVALVSGIIATFLGVIIGIFVFTTFGNHFHIYVDRISTILYSIPSIAIIMICLNVFGTGKTTGAIAIISQALLPIISSTYSGISSINKDVIEVAKGVGMSPLQALFKVQLPTALPVIVSGIRVSMIICVSSTTLAYQAGAGGLGMMIFSGFTTYDFVSIFAGTFPICLLALLFDQFFKSIETGLLVRKGG